MAVSPAQSPSTSLVTKDAMFLFDLFRESPTPILIHIGPFAQKTGAKPNTIIKRLAGIKARNGLNISTTLGTLKRPTTSEAGIVKARPIKKQVKKETHQDCDVHFELGAKSEGREMMHMASGGLKPNSECGNELPTPATSPSTSVSSAHGFYRDNFTQSNNYLSPAPNSINLSSSHPKRTLQQRLESEMDGSDLDGTPWKRIKVE